MASSLKNLALVSALLLACLVVAHADDEIPTECPAVDPPNVVTHLAFEGDCTKFYKCSHGEKFEMQCPVFNENGDRLYFNASLQVCNWPDQVDCQQPEPTPEPEKARSLSRSAATPFIVATECPKTNPINETVYLLHEDDCTKFYTCNHGAKFEMQCPVINEEGDRLYFNPENERCDWPEKVNCKQPNPPAKMMNLARLADVPTECPAVDIPEEPVLLEHDEDCTKFYQCSNGAKVELQCPEYNEEGDRLQFNVAEQICDWPENVNCKN